MNQKNPFDDIIRTDSGATATAAPAKRSIRNIPLREKKPNKIDELLEETADMRAEHQHHTPPPAYIPPVEQPRFYPEKRSGKAWVWIVAVIAVIVLTFGALTFFKSAQVNIVLNVESIPVEVVATSTTSAASSTLPYEIIPVQKEGTKEVEATGTPTKVEKKASGTIIVYNKTASSQQFVATTRFETPEGLVYRIDKPITIPANGSIEALVFADQPGETYNIDMKDFTVPGLKGGPKYDQFYGRSKTAMTGGFIGNLPKIADADLKAANEELEASLTAQALEEIRSQKGDDNVFFEEGIRSTYISSVGPSNTNGKAMVTGKVVVEGIIFELADVEEAVSNALNGEKHHFDNIEDLALTIQNQTPVASFINGPTLLIKLAGTLTTGQSFDENAMKKAIAGKSRSQLTEILKMYPEITKAEDAVRPFWSSTFPDNPEKITINVTK